MREREKDMRREVEKKWESERDSKGDGVWKEKQQRKGKKRFPLKCLATIETPFLILKISVWGLFFINGGFKTARKKRKRKSFV